MDEVSGAAGQGEVPGEGSRHRRSSRGRARHSARPTPEPEAGGRPELPAPERPARRVCCDRADPTAAPCHQHCHPVRGEEAEAPECEHSLRAVSGANPAPAGLTAPSPTSPWSREETQQADGRRRGPRALARWHPLAVVRWCPPPPHLRLAVLGQEKPGASPKVTQRDRAAPGLSLVPLPHPQAEGLVWEGDFVPGFPPAICGTLQLPGRVLYPVRPQLCGSARPRRPALRSRAGPMGKGQEDAQASVCPSPCLAGTRSVPRPGARLAGRTWSPGQQGGRCREPPLPTAPTSPARCRGPWSRPCLT